jgi:hypothetical protein
MSKAISNYLRVARRRWGRQTEWIAGDGAFATLAKCRYFSVELHPTIEAAREALNRINLDGCGGHCKRNHSLVDLRGA